MERIMDPGDIPDNYSSSSQNSPENFEETFKKIGFEKIKPITKQVLSTIGWRTHAQMFGGFSRSNENLSLPLKGEVISEDDNSIHIDGYDDDDYDGDNDGFDDDGNNFDGNAHKTLSNLSIFLHRQDFLLCPIELSVLKLSDLTSHQYLSDVELNISKQFLKKIFDELGFYCIFNSNHLLYDYFIRFSLKIVSNLDIFELSKQKFLLPLLENFRRKLQKSNEIIELPFNTLKFMMKEASNVFEVSQFFGSKIGSISFGSIINLSSFVKRLEASKIDDIGFPEMEIDFRRNSIAFNFCVSNLIYRLETSFLCLKYLLLDIEQIDNYDRFYLELNFAPFLLNLNIEKTKFGPKIRWKRVKNFLENSSDHSDGSDDDPDLLGNAYGLRIDINSPKNLSYLIALCYYCKDLNPNFSFYLGKVKESPIHALPLRKVYEEIDEKFENNFAIIYACRVLFSKSYKVIDHLVENHSNDRENGFSIFLEKIHCLLQKEDTTLIEDCIYSLDTKFKNRLIDLMVEFQKIYDEKKERFNTIKGKDVKDHVIMRSAILTPTKIEFGRPMAFLRSRFSNIANLDYALRLTISEDNNRSLNSMNNETDFIKKSVRPRLLEGITVGDRKFEFLGSSSSQMRECGIVFYAKDDKGRTAESIRELVGDLSDYKRKVAKYISRFGLIFSQAIAYYHYDPKSVRLIIGYDVTTKDEEFNFTDGIGIISTSLAKNIVPLFRLPPNYFPSAFQIRHGGCKGMLVCYDLEEKTILFRNSMIKFESDDHNLGILKFSAPRCLYFNRPFIAILDQQYVPTTLFYKIFTESTQLITRSLLFEWDAYNLVRSYNNRNIQYDKFYKVGMSFLREPFLRRVLNHLVSYKLNELKSRNRIKLPHSCSRMAFGVIDESKKLESGEIFFQYTELDEFFQPTEKTTILDDITVMVTKFPCLSLGDVRKFRAVDIPLLHHIKDCIVFPAKGDRPHTDEMGGSDLDGDEYAIIWNSELIFPGKNFRPMDFPSPDPVELSRDIELSDIVDFYCEYLIENNIGQVANCHLMYSDFHPMGLRSQECEELALKYSISLDFQKNGVNSSLEPKYKPNYNWIRPDFMEKKGYTRSYLSNKILGQFYRQCCLIEDIVSTFDEFLIAYEENTVRKPDNKMIMQDWRKYETEALEAYLEYTEMAVQTMEMMNLDSEVKFLTNVYEEKTDATFIVYNSFFNHFREKFLSQSEGKSEFEKMLLCSAWYAICFDKCDLMQFQYRDQPLFGLPFIIADEIVQLKTYLQPQNPPCLMDELFESRIELIDPQTCINYTTLLIMFWIKKWNHAFRHKFKLIRILNDDSKTWKAISENELLEKIIKKKLESIIREHEHYLTIIRKSQYNMKAILFLFNKFMYYLYQMCDRLNDYILAGDLKEILLLRYAVYALNFIEKLDGFFSDKKCSAIFRKDETALVTLKSCIEAVMSNFSRYSGSLIEQTEFCVLNKDLYDQDKVTLIKIDYSKLDGNFFRKIKLLAGAIMDLKVFNQERQCIFFTRNNHLHFNKNRELTATDAGYGRMPSDRLGYNLQRVNVDYYSLRIKGFRVSNSLLRSFLGHPEFYRNVFRNFDICIQQKDSGYHSLDRI